MTHGAGVKLLAAYLGCTPGHLRLIITTHGVQSIGTAWKAKMYDGSEVIRHARGRCGCPPSPARRTLKAGDRIP